MITFTCFSRRAIPGLISHQPILLMKDFPRTLAYSATRPYSGFSSMDATEETSKNRTNVLGDGHKERTSRRSLASFSLQGKVCVVTGAARGLGNVYARAFIESGCSELAMLDLKQPEAQQAADELVERLERHGEIEKGEVAAIGLGCDVSNEEDVQDAFKTIVDTFGRVDVVVANVGITENYPALEFPTDRLRKTFAVNVLGAFFCAREAAKHMIEKGTQGSIVLIASMSANIVNYPQPQAPYNSSKAAVKHMAKCLAVEWAAKGIRVNTLSPGYMLTPLAKDILADKEDLRRGWEMATPMRKMGDPEDLKGAIVYLASDASKFTTGSELVVDGGFSII